MGNVLRVLGIVLASMLLGLVGLFLLLFTICGGLKSADGGPILAICLLLMAGGIGLIVFLGRGIVAARAASPGLAVPPAGAAPPAPTPAAPSPRPALPLRPFAGTDLQVLVGLRVGLAILILLSLGSMAFNFVNFGRFGSSVAIQLTLRSILGLLPPVALLVAVSVRNPPAGSGAGRGRRVRRRVHHLPLRLPRFRRRVQSGVQPGGHPVHDAGAARRLQRARSGHRRPGGVPAQPRRADQRGHA